MILEFKEERRGRVAQAVLIRMQRGKQIVVGSGVILGLYGLGSFLKDFKREDVGLMISESLRGLGKIPVSLISAFKSRNVRNIIAASILLTITAKRLGLLAKRSLAQLFGICFVLIWSGHYRFSVVETARIHTKRTHWNLQVLERSNLSKIEYYPIFHSYNRHLMTILWTEIGGFYMSFAPEMVYRREELVADDGNVIMLDWAVHEGVPLSDDSPIIFLVHGLGGDSSGQYIRRFASLAHAIGWRCVSYHYWRLDWVEARDMEIAVNHVSEKFPKAPLCGIGFSAGCHKLTKYLQFSGSGSPFVAAVTVSGVLDLQSTYDDVKENENRLYKMWMDTQVITLVQRHVYRDKTLSKTVKKMMTEAIHEEQNHGSRLYDKFQHILHHAKKRNYVPNSGVDNKEDKSLRDGFDQEENIPPWTYQGNEALKYHYSQKAGNHMDKIQVSTLMLHALDDPIVTSKSINWDEVVKNKNIIIAHTKRGGHIGFVEGATPLGATWSDRMAIKFISSILELHAQNNFMISVIRESLKQDSMKDKMSNSSSASLLSNEMKPSRMARICSVSDVKGWNH